VKAAFKYLKTMSKLRKFKVLVIQHLLKNNKTAKSGDIIDETKFINLEDSLKGNYVVEVFEDNSEKADKSKDKSKSKDKDKTKDKSKDKKADKGDKKNTDSDANVDDAGDNTATELENELKKVKRMNKETLIGYATENKLSFDPEANKQVILDSIVEQLTTAKS
jgi:hypothetical protein